MDFEGRIHRLLPPEESTPEERDRALRRLAAEFGPLVLLSASEETKLAALSPAERKREYLRLRAERGAVGVEPTPAVPSLKQRRALKRKSRAKRKAERARRKGR